MSTDGVLAALSIQSILFLFLAPTIFLIICIYIARRLKSKLNKRKSNKKQVENKISRERIENRREAVKILESDNNELAMKKLHDLTVKPMDMKKYRGLELNFDDSGEVTNTHD